MTPRIISLILAFILALVELAFAQTTTKTPSSPPKKPYALADITQLKFTSDLDDMVQRRYIRVLVTYSKTHYFVDKGTAGTYLRFRPDV